MENIHRTPKNTSPEVQADIDIEKDSDEILAQKVELRLSEGQTLYDAIKKEVEENEKVFFGELETLAGTDLAKYNSKTLLNRFFLTIRNLVGLDTDSLPKIQMIPSKDTKPSIKRAEKIRNAVDYGFIRVNFLDIITKALFDTRTKRDSFARWFWNYEKNDFDLELVQIEDITISPEATTIQDAEWLVYHPLKNRTWWKKHYPEQYEELEFENVSQQARPLSAGNVKEVSQRGSAARLYQYWENNLLIEKAYGKEGKEIILKKSKNPYYEYRDPLLQLSSWASQARPEAFAIAQETGLPMEQALPEVLDPMDMEEFEPIVNFLSESRKPFVQFPSMKLAGKFYSANLIKQGRETLISYNRKKRQIEDNLRGCNTKLVIDKDQFSEEEASAINDEPMQVLLANMQTNPNPVQMVAPSFPQLSGLLADMRHDEEYIDDLFAHHEISRGSGDADTLGQDEINLQSDRVPVRMQSRAIEDAIKEIVEGWIQLMKMFYTEKHWVKKLGGKEGVEMHELINRDIEQGIEPLVVPQSMIKVDKVARAIELWNAGALDPFTLFKEMNMQNPRELADRLINFKKFSVISDESPEQIQADMAIAQAGANGDGTENPVERANNENEAFQGGQGSDVPPTPRELVDKKHVALHYQFYKDPSKKMEQEDMDYLLAHAETDKATLMENMKEMAIGMAREQIKGERQVKNNQQNNEVQS